VTNHEFTRIDTNDQKVLFKEEVFRSIGCAIEVLNGHTVGLFIPDLIAFEMVVVDTKVVERITDHEHGLMLNYLRTTKLRVGVILNFKRAKLEWERLVL